MADLVARGWNPTLIARRIGVSQPTIYAIATGATRDPSYRVGKALESLRESGERPANREPANG